jgi:hypothetical protein
VSSASGTAITLPIATASTPASSVFTNASRKSGRAKKASSGRSVGVPPSRNATDSTWSSG